MIRFAAIGAACALVAAPAALAQDAVDALLTQPAAPPETPAQAQPRQTWTPPASVAPEPEEPVYDPERAVTRQLNIRVDERNRAVRESNTAAESEYARQQGDHVAWLERLEREREEELAAYDAAQRAHEAEVADWRRRVEACLAGDRRFCAPAPIR